jgi:hypothetical protein
MLDAIGRMMPLENYDWRASVCESRSDFNFLTCARPSAMNADGDKSGRLRP